MNARYGWSYHHCSLCGDPRGVYKSFEITRGHFMQEYGRQIRYFIYNSSRLDEIDRFAQGAEIKVMIFYSNQRVADFRQFKRGA